MGKELDSGAGQSAFCRFENNILPTEEGLKALEDGLNRYAETLLRRRNKRRPIVDVDSTEDAVHGKQEGAAFNGYFEQVCLPSIDSITRRLVKVGARVVYHILRSVEFSPELLEHDRGNEAMSCEAGGVS